MPLTPLHYPVTYFIYKLNKQLSLPGLIVGCMFPDLEIPFMVLIFGTQGPNRMILHSLLGSATIGMLLSITFTVRIYPFLTNRLFNLNKKEIETKCRLSFVTVISVLFGLISHVLLDVSNHPYNPIFWPFIPAASTPSPIFFALGNQFSYFWIQIIMGTILLALILVKRKNLFQNILIG